MLTSVNSRSSTPAGKALKGLVSTPAGPRSSVALTCACIWQSVRSGTSVTAEVMGPVPLDMGVRRGQGPKLVGVAVEVGVTVKRVGVAVEGMV